jgi:hypothetical protein
MKIDKIEKAIIIGLSILLVISLVLNLKAYIIKKAQRRFPSEIFVPTFEEFQLPEDIRKQAKTFGAYDELYGSDKPTFVYSYSTINKKSHLNEKFHKNLSARLKKENLDYKYVVYKDWENDTDEIERKNQEKINTTETCAPAEGQEKELEDFIKISHHCINNACIIDVKNHKYVIISPDANYIINVLKEYKGVKK